MTGEEVIALFKQTGGLLEGHFVYASGRHGRQFLQAARLMQYPQATERMCRALAECFKGANIELVAGPATGGIILAYETARQLGCRGVFLEKELDGSMTLKRGFRLDPGTRVLMVEDIVTTGGSLKKSMAHLRARGAEIVGVGALVDRSGGEADFGITFHALVELHLESFPADAIPEDLAKVPVSEPDDLVV